MSLNLRKLFCNLKIFARKRGYVTFVPKTPMKTVLGPFHPHLENALVEEIRGQKADNPLLPVLILVPSDSLRRRLKILLTREQNLSLVNLQLLTFHQLSLRLSAEVNGVNLPTLRDDLFLEEVLRQIIRTKQPGTEAFAGIEERAGGCAALWQTLRDLRDGMVEPSVVLEALREGHFAARTSERTSHLLALLQTLLLFCKEKGIEDHSDLDKLTQRDRSLRRAFSASSRRFSITASTILTQITGGSLSLQSYRIIRPPFSSRSCGRSQATRAGVSPSAFTNATFRAEPALRAMTNLVETPARQDTLSPTFRLFDQVGERPYAPLPKKWRCQILNAFGIHDEVGAAAKEILRLVDDDEMTFNDIGVVARSLDDLRATNQRNLSQSSHPHDRRDRRAAGAVSLDQGSDPAAQSAGKRLSPDPGHRSLVFPLLSIGLAQAWKQSPPRPDLWDLATRELAICKGMQEWHRLSITRHEI